MSFQEHSKAAVRRFLKTAILLDEKAFAQDTSNSTATTVTAAADATSTDEPLPRGDYSSSNSVQENHTAAESTRHNLDTQALVRGFAKAGIMCSVLSPDSSTDITTRNLVIQSAQETDIAIFDWEIYGNPEYTLDALYQVFLNAHQSNRTRLRLIVIYTGSSSVKDIRDKIAQRIKQFVPKIECTKSANGFDNGLKAENLGICVLCKPTIPTDKLTEIESIDFDQLAERIVTEFAYMANGLVQGLALNALAALRENMHTLLSQVHPELDAPYLTHRVLLPVPDDAEDHMVAMIVSELSSILDQSSVKDSVNLNAIKSWVEANKNELPLHKLFRSNSQGHLGENDQLPQTAIDDVVKLFEFGCDKASQSKLPPTLVPPGGKPHKNITGDSFRSRKYRKNGDELNCNFAVLNAMQTRYNSYLPRLELGQIVERSKDGSKEYLICLHPKCDSVRIREKRKHADGTDEILPGKQKFLFAKCQEKTRSEPHDYVIQMPDKTYKHLKVSIKPHDCELIEFSAGQTECVLASLQENEHVFTATTGEKLKWLAEMKPEYAQDIAVKVGSNLTRVATNNAEWLRRLATSTD